MYYLVYFAIIILIPLWAQSRVKSTFAKYSRVPSSTSRRGAEVAREILNANGLYHVGIEESRGRLSDHYDPKMKSVRLSSENYHGHSIAAAAVASHECGHAIQDSEGYAFLRFRHALVPVANIGSSFSWILIMVGILIHLSRRPSGLRKTKSRVNSLAHRTTWLRSDLWPCNSRFRRICIFTLPPCTSSGRKYRI